MYKNLDLGKVDYDVGISSQYYDLGREDYDLGKDVEVPIKGKFNIGNSKKITKEKFTNMVDERLSEPNIDRAINKICELSNINSDDTDIIKINKSKKNERIGKIIIEFLKLINLESIEVDKTEFRKFDICTSELYPSDRGTCRCIGFLDIDNTGLVYYIVFIDLYHLLIPCCYKNLKHEQFIKEIYLQNKDKNKTIHKKYKNKLEEFNI